MKQWQILLFISFIYYICIEAEFPYLGGEGGSQGLTRKNRPCVLNSLSEDPLKITLDLPLKSIKGNQLCHLRRVGAGSVEGDRRVVVAMLLWLHLSC